MKSPSRVQFFATPWTAAYQAPLPMGFSRQEYWSGVPLPSPLYVYMCVCVYIYIYKYVYILYVYIHIKQVMMEMLVKCYNFKQTGRNNLWEEWGRI